MEGKENSNLANIVSPNTKRDEFITIVEKILTPKEKSFLGPDASNKVTEAFGFLGAFVEETAGFDREAFRFVNQVELRSKEADIVFDFLIRTHLVVPFMNENLEIENSRYTISHEIKEMLSEESGNGFLT